MSALSRDVLEAGDQAPNTTQAAEGLPRRRFSVAEIEAFVRTGLIPEHERFELIGGEIVPMSPKGMRHERIKTWLAKTLYRQLPDRFLTTSETTLKLGSDTFLEPDFVLYETTSGIGSLDPSTCLLAIEIGISSLAYDQGPKAAIYASFGVRELWVIDGTRLKTRVFREPGPDGYGWIADHAPTEALEPLAVPGFSLTLYDYESFEG
ncbi:Uma2 family endonuclease [Fulvimarina sp. MAC3]|uniref:Uma2 family endonuclease n=1 Tax=Fulvimarina sp. MAC3 TaxID=3148887 RepID=UPI0031FBAB2B